MIDIEQDVIDLLVDAFRAEYGQKIYITDEDPSASSSFPCVSIKEIENTSVVGTQDSGGNDNHATITFQIDAYSNKSKGKKAQAKEIMNIVDGVFNDIGFTRIGSTPTSMNSATVYRLINRYIAVVSKDNVIYRR